MMKEEPMIVFTTDIEESEAQKFDAIAEKHLRSRTAHLKYIILQTIKKENENDKTKGKSGVPGR